MALCIKHCIKTKQGISITLMRRPIYQVFILLFTLLIFSKMKRQMVLNHVYILCAEGALHQKHKDWRRATFNYSQTKLFHIQTREKSRKSHKD